MRYVDEFRDKRLIDTMARKIRRAASGGSRAHTFMEVCGTHTMSICRSGLRALLPDNVRLVSGPGCPVCVTPNSYIDKAIAYSRLNDVIITTFGDMFRVPGSNSSLEKERALGGNIVMVYSTEDALEIAGKNPSKPVIFLGIGFETTAPTVAEAILEAKRKRLKNFFVYSGHKTMPGPLKALASDRSIAVDGFLLPGHVSAVIGSRPYGFLAARFGKRCVVSGFEPLDIMQSILMLLKQRKPQVEIQYTRLVKPGGNPTARKIMREVFEETDSTWRGIGGIKKSGLRIRKKYSAFDAEANFEVKVRESKENALCICGDVLKGIREPEECALFAGSCKPEHPVGACMVSSEGACAAWYKYGTR